MVDFVLLIQFPTIRWSTPSPSGGGECFALFRAIPLAEYFPHISLTAFQKRLGVYGCHPSSAEGTQWPTRPNRVGINVCRVSSWGRAASLSTASQILIRAFTIFHPFSLARNSAGLSQAGRQLPPRLIDDFTGSGHGICTVFHIPLQRFASPANNSFRQAAIFRPPASAIRTGVVYADMACATAATAPALSAGTVLRRTPRRILQSCTFGDIGQSFQILPAPAVMSTGNITAVAIFCIAVRNLDLSCFYLASAGCIGRSIFHLVDTIPHHLIVGIAACCISLFPWTFSLFLAVQILT